MDAPRLENESRSKIRQGFVLGVLCVLVGALLCGGFLAIGKYSATCGVVRTGTPATAMSPDVYLAEITDFYECIISVLFGTVGIVLAVAFVYVHAVSKQQARDMAVEAIDSTSFERLVDVRFDKIRSAMSALLKKEFLKQKNSRELESQRADLRDLIERLEFVEMALNDYVENRPTGLRLRETSIDEKEAADGSN